MYLRATASGKGAVAPSCYNYEHIFIISNPVYVPALSNAGLLKQGIRHGRHRMDANARVHFLGVPKEDSGPRQRHKSRAQAETSGEICGVPQSSTNTRRAQPFKLRRRNNFRWREVVERMASRAEDSLGTT